MTTPDASTTNPSGSAPEATLISVILDRSGSMGTVREPTIAGFNEFVREQRTQKDGGRALMSLTQFDDRFEVNFVGEPIENVPDLDTDSYVPRGSTALHDAIGRTVHELEAWTKKNSWKERVLVLIVTDGQENASQEYTLHSIRALIEQKEKDGWNFAYMGANQDAYAVGDAMNVRSGYSANWDASPDGMAMSYSRMARGASSYRAGKMKGVHAQAIFDPADEPVKAKPPAGKLTPKGSKSPSRAR